MECTQRLDFELSQTQTQTERTCPEQIGFLGILGTKYPVMRGPNKIGRDPQTCSIVLNLNSISRQHAVLNVLNGRDFMLMDLDSANKTRINNKSLQAYIPVAICNGDTVQFGEVFGVFRLLADDTDLPSTQAVDVPDTPSAPAAPRPARLRPATVPESPDVSDKDDSFIMPSQPKSQHKFKGPGNNFIKSSSKTISIQPVGSNKIDNVYWNSSKKSDSFHLDDSSNSLEESNQNGIINNRDIQLQNDSTDSIYTAETQLPPKCASIHSQDTQMAKNDDIFDAETQLSRELSPKNNIDESIYESNTQLPFEQPNIINKDNIFEADTQLPSKTVLNNNGKNIHDMETQVPFPTHNASTDSIYVAETQLPSNNASPSIYSQETQLPKLDDLGIRESPKSIYDVNTQLPFEEPNVSSKQNYDIFDADTQLPNKHVEIKNPSESNPDANTKLCTEKSTDSEENNDDIFEAATQRLTVPNFDLSKDIENKLEDNIQDKFDKSDEVILFNEVDDDFDDFNASQPILGDIQLIQEDNEEIPLSQSDTITDDDFEIRLEESKTEDKPAKRDARVISTDCEGLNFLSTQKIPENPQNEDEETDCEEEELPGKRDALSANLKSDISNLATQVIPEAGPSCPFDELLTQVIPEINVDDNVQKPHNKSNEQNFEDMLTQVIVPEDNGDKDMHFEDLPTQVILEDVPSKSSKECLQFSEEIIASPFKVPLQTPIKIKKKDTPHKASDLKTTNSTGERNDKNKDADEKYYAATQELFNDLCSQPNSLIDSRNMNNNVLKNKINELDKSKEKIGFIEDKKIGTKVTNFEGEMEISVKKFMRESSSGSSDGEEKINQITKQLSAKQISDVIGVAMVTRVPSDPSDVDVTPKKVRPGKFMETLLPDSQEIKTSVSLSTKTEATDSSSESEKESQEQTPIVFRKKKRAKADVKKDLSSKFDIQSLPTRIITRMRKPTSKVKENEVDSKKRGRNILKPKFLNDSEQDEIDTEIISENITRLRSKNDKKVHKDTSAEGERIEEIKSETNKRKSDEENSRVAKAKPTKQDNRNKSKNNSKESVVDLTNVDEEKPKLRRKNEKSKNTKDVGDNSKRNIKLTDTNTKDDNDLNKNTLNDSEHKSDYNKSISEKNTKDTIVDLTGSIEEKHRTKRNHGQSKSNENVVEDNTKVEKVASKRKLDQTGTSEEKSNETEKRSRIRKKDVQDKITKYTVTTDKNRIDESQNDDKNSTVSTRHSREDRSVQEEHETTKRKRGRPRKEDKHKINKDKKVVQDKKDNEEVLKQKTDEKQEEEQIEVRRSRRQRVAKENSQSTSRNHEQSAVYSLSSESGADSPKRKRKDYTIDAEVPTSKRTRSNTGAVVVSSDTSSVSTTVNSNTSSLRSTPSRGPATQYVLFTAYPNDEVKTILEGLGAVVVADVASCTVVVTLQLRRTFKLLCAVGLGRPIVGPNWVQACHDHGALQDPWQYILQDCASEARFGFSLRRTLTGPRGYLRGYHVTATPAVLPTEQEMKLIVECSGGRWGRGPAGRWLAVSCAADRALHAPLRARGAALVNTELILSGVLTQRLDIHAHTIN